MGQGPAREGQRPVPYQPSLKDWDLFGEGTSRAESLIHRTTPALRNGSGFQPSGRWGYSDPALQAGLVWVGPLVLKMESLRFIGPEDGEPALYSTAGFSQCPAPFAFNDFPRP